MHKRLFAQEQKDLCEKSFVQNVLYSESWFCTYQITHQVKRFLTQSEYKGISCPDKRSATRRNKNCKITRCPWNCVDDSFIAWRWMYLLHKVKVDLGTGKSELWQKHNFETYLENHKNWGKHMLNVVLTAVMVLTSQTLMVPSKEAVANKSGLSGLNLQSNIVSIWP